MVKTQYEQIIDKRLLEVNSNRIPFEYQSGHLLMRESFDNLRFDVQELSFTRAGDETHRLTPLVRTRGCLFGLLFKIKIEIYIRC